MYYIVRVKILHSLNDLFQNALDFGQIKRVSLLVYACEVVVHVFENEECTASVEVFLSGLCLYYFLKFNNVLMIHLLEQLYFPKGRQRKSILYYFRVFGFELL